MIIGFTGTQSGMTESARMTFPDFLRSLQIIPPEHYKLGQWQRCATVNHERKRNASVKLGEDGRHGWAVNFESGAGAHRWSDGNAIERTAEERARDNARLSERIAKRREVEIAGIMRARTAYNAATPLRFANHDYLRRKRLDMTGCAGIKVDTEGALVIPKHRDGKLVSVERIFPDGSKKSAWQAPSKGASFKIWRPGASVTILCEGFATGLTVFAAVPQSTVVVCFSASNLVEVARREDWRGMVAIAADNDADTEANLGTNPGKEAGTKAAEAIGCGVAWPEFDGGSDWHDMFVARLELLEKREAEAQWPRSPVKLRQEALLPIKTALLNAMKFVGQK